jgi:hypothetical protein
VLGRPWRSTGQVVKFAQLSGLRLEKKTFRKDHKMSKEATLGSIKIRLGGSENP